MDITVKNDKATIKLRSLDVGDVFTTPDYPTTFFLVIEPEFELDPDAGTYAVCLENGYLFRFDDSKDVIYVQFEATASF